MSLSTGCRAAAISSSATTCWSTANAASRSQRATRKRPTLIIGSGTGIGHGCVFHDRQEHHDRAGTAGSPPGVWMFDSPGHPSDPQARLDNDRLHWTPTSSRSSIADNVWIGGRAVIFPGVTIGEGSIVSACAVVTADVPAYSIVAGNPARRIGTLHSARSRTSSEGYTDRRGQRRFADNNRTRANDRQDRRASKPAKISTMPDFPRSTRCSF